MWVENECSLLSLVFPLKCPQRIAVTYTDGDSQTSLTYEEVDRAANQIHDAIVARGMCNRVVSLTVENHLLVPSLVLGILKAEATFSFLDGDLQHKRQADCLSSSGAGLLVCDHPVSFPEWTNVVTLKLLGVYDIYILQPNSGSTLPTLPASLKLAYIVHTSGSTGHPKVVKVPHSCISPNILDLSEAFQMEGTDVILACSPFTFDPSVVDLFLALSSGARLLLVKPSIKRMPLKLAQIIRQERVTFIQATPSLFLQFGSDVAKEYLCSPSSALRIVVLGGEAFPALSTIREFRAKGNATQFYNIYGITEVSCWATMVRVDLAELDGPVDIGRCLRGTVLKVVNNEGQEISQGEGVLLIGGRHRVCLLDGETCIRDPVVYRNTGDRVKVVNGLYFYLGRVDETVKRMGQRVNLHSVEQLALSSGLVRQCCALISERNLLVLFCVMSGAVLQLKQFFIANALDRERPDEIVQLQSLPVSKHGKTSRSQLLAAIPHAANQANWLDYLAREWAEATGQPASGPITSGANFILSGGTSLSAVRLSVRVQEHINRRLPRLLDILLNRDWGELVQHIQREGEPAEECATIYQRSRDAPSSITRPEPAGVSQSVRLEMEWMFDMKKCVDASPLIVRRKDRSTVYIGSHSHLFCAVDMDTGHERWSIELPDRIESSATCDPLGEQIIVGCYDGRVYSLDAVDGHIRWSFPTGDAVKSSPLCLGRTVVVGSHDRILYCLSIDDGTAVWSAAISAGSIFAAPCWDASTGRVVAASLDGTCAALEAVTGRVAWSVQLPQPVFAAPVISDGACLVASVDGLLRRLDPATGDCLWQFRAGGPIFSTPSVADGRIIFGCHDHCLYCVDGQQGQQTWQVKFTSPVYSSPCFCPLTSTVSCCDTAGNLRIVDLDSGTVLAQTKLNGETFSSPVLAGRRIVVGNRDNHVYSFSLKPL